MYKYLEHNLEDRYKVEGGVLKDKAPDGWL